MKSKGMRIAGGVLALVACIGGTIAGLLTVFFGAVAGATGELVTKVGDPRNQAATLSDQSSTLMNMGWFGVLASFVALVTGIVVITSKSQKAAWILLVFSFLGIVFGGTIVAFFMILAVLGAIFALVGGSRPKEVPSSIPAESP